MRNTPTIKQLRAHIRANCRAWFSSAEPTSEAFFGRCDQAAVWLADMVGGNKVRGWYVGEISTLALQEAPDGNLGHCHSWVVKDGRILDPTWWQFTEAKAGIYTFEGNDSRFIVDAEA